MSEFALIDRYFSRKGSGIGDDCAIVNVPTGFQLALSTDTLIEGVHFAKDANPVNVGYKSLAVSLSDLASCGARPDHATLCITLPQHDENWLSAFSRGFFECADAFGVKLIGGDTTKGSLSITVQAHGFVKIGAALLRSGARAGDAICVTGTLGTAALGLRDSGTNGAPRLHRPTPRVEAGQALVDVATSAIDISDGFHQDLNHILTQSTVGADIWLDKLPIATSVTKALAVQAALSGGDDYELCFTVPQNRLGILESINATEVGVIKEGTGCRLIDADGKIAEHDTKGYQHF